ncbi:ASPIC/UnbV domain-containing protein [Saccharomonospora iraqiensis]|uniref:ASPIC/UnbV domain-containing protein n=1 Tax=Saccharomonospora iraqiensis TaxID=52698 RepID=UPI00022DE923|nr:ASPIC/UnbV domain-containing protein [Saccharomonospora iraqiensis]
MRIPVRKLLAPVVVVSLCAALGVMVARPGLSEEEIGELADGFRFVEQRVNSAPPDARTAREVAPGVDGIGAWISSVGAAAGLSDVRGLGRPGDLCLVDPRDDSVTLRPARPSADGGYDPVHLRPDGLPYDDTMAPMGCVPADIDADGDIDHLVHYWGRSPVVFLNTGGVGVPTADGHRPVELIEPSSVWNSATLNVGDVDGDGNLDLLIGNYFPDGARVLDPTADDTRMEMQDSMSLARNGGRNRLLLTEPTGRPDELPKITDASNALTRASASSWTLATGMQDLTGDGRPEIYQANDFGPDQLMLNESTPGRVRLTEVRGDRDLVTPKSMVLGHDSFKGMGVTFTYDGDAALPTILVSNITTPFALHESNLAFVPSGKPEDLVEGRVPFTQRAESLGIARSGWSWDVRAGDFNNDGVDEIMQANGFLRGEIDRWPVLQELAMGNDELVHDPAFWPEFGPGDDLSGHEPNRFFVRGPNGRYADLSGRSGLSDDDNTRALVFGDVDGDGRLDAVAANQWQDSVLLLNRASAGASAGLRLVRAAGAGSDGAVTPAIGAQIRLHDPERPQRAQLYPANGHTGVSSSELHFALPSDESVPATVTWRDAGGKHEARVEISPGRSTILLTTDGTAEVR